MVERKKKKNRKIQGSTGKKSLEKGRILMEKVGRGLMKWQVTSRVKEKEKGWSDRRRERKYT